MFTAESMYEECRRRGYADGVADCDPVECFRIIEHRLRPGENVELAFMGLRDFESTTKHEYNHAYVLTDERLLIARQGPIFSYYDEIDRERITCFRMDATFFLGTIFVCTFWETRAIGMGRTAAEAIYEELELMGLAR